jgi:predicted enzyme related to lactoylglutathione lyase
VGFGDVLVNLILVGDRSSPWPGLGSSPCVFGLAVTDTEAAIEHLESFGATVARAIWSGQTFWGRQVVLNVPGGAAIALREWRNPDGPHFNAWQPEQYRPEGKKTCSSGIR